MSSFMCVFVCVCVHMCLHVLHPVSKHPQMNSYSLNDLPSLSCCAHPPATPLSRNLSTVSLGALDRLLTLMHTSMFFKFGLYLCAYFSPAPMNITELGCSHCCMLTPAQRSSIFPSPPSESSPESNAGKAHGQPQPETVFCCITSQLTLIWCVSHSAIIGFVCLFVCFIQVYRFHPPDQFFISLRTKHCTQCLKILPGERPSLLG